MVMSRSPGKGRGSAARRKAAGSVAPRGDGSAAVLSPEKESGALAYAMPAAMPAGMVDRDARRAESGEPYSTADLTASRVAAEEREMTADEERLVRREVASAGFIRPASGAPRRARGGWGWQKVKPRLEGMSHREREVRGREFIPTADFHYLDHARSNGASGAEWPEGTTQEGYEANIRELIESPSSGILYSNRGGRGGHLAFVMRTPEEWRGENGREWVFCEYFMESGHWSTGFQRKHDPERIADDPKREEQIWLRRPED